MYDDMMVFRYAVHMYMSLFCIHAKAPRPKDGLCYTLQ